MLNGLGNAPRLLMEVELKPVQGDRFQPTGFADLGAATYERADGTRMLLVESAQSMANRLEKTCLDGDGPHIAAEFEGLPYVVAKLRGASRIETSSLVEAHRLNSPFIIKKDWFKKEFIENSDYAENRPIDWRKTSRTLFRFDPNSLIHGVFMSNLEGGRIKLARALSAFIEAENISEVASGGVKNNHFDPSGNIQVEGENKEGIYQNIPYHRTEYVAGKVKAFFNLDLAILRGYGFPQEAMELLVGLSLYKIRRFLEQGLRLRTACDFTICGDVETKEPAGYLLPKTAALLSYVKERIVSCGKAGLFAKPAVTRIEVDTVFKKKKEKTSPESVNETEVEG